MCVLIHTCRVKRGGEGGLFISMVLGECVTVGVREERLVSLKPERWEEINNKCTQRNQFMQSGSRFIFYRKTKNGFAGEGREGGSAPPPP